MGGTGASIAWHLLIYPAMRIHDDEVVAKSICFGQSLNSQEETGLKYTMRNMQSLVIAGLFTAICLQTTGCSNPADDKFKAEATPPKPSNKTSTTSATDGDKAPEAKALPAGAKLVKAVAASSKIEFTGSKVTGKHDGGFKLFTAEAQVDSAKKQLIDFKATIDMNSTWSDSDRLTGHLKNQDFFDVAKFPTSVFEATEIKAVGGETKPAGSTHSITGNLTLHGVTKSIAFPAKVAIAENGGVMFDTEFAINRKDFGIVYPGKTDDLIRDEVVLRLNVKAE
jgi:polyisoprenoid-binding protein YceI